MLQFLKNLFAKEIPETKVAFSEFEKFLDEKSGPFEEQLKKDIEHIIDEIKKEAKGIVLKLEDLEKADLQNPNINNRAKTVMEGNRDAFIKSLTRFFDSLDIPFEDFNQVTEHSKKVTKEMDALANSTARSYAILTQFFAREVSTITETIKKIDTYLKDIVHLIEDNTLTKIKDLKKQIHEINKKIENKQRHQKDLDEHKQKKSKSEDHVSEKKKQSKEKKESSGFQEYEEFVSQKESFEKTLKEIEDSLFHDFSDLEKALKKYSKIAVTHEKLVEDYLTSSMKALVKDEKLDVVGMLDGLKKSLEKDGLGLEDKKKGKTLSKIEQLTKEHFSNLQNKYNETKLHLDKILKSIETHATKQEIDALEKEIEKIEKEIESFTESIKELESEIAKIDIDALKKELQENVNLKLKDLSEKITIH